jgi:mevalonate kinase
VPEHLEPRPNRRATDLGPGDTPRARQARLVRMIAADPELVGWFATSKARTLNAVAAELSGAGHGDAAELVARYAQALASGDRSPF